MVGRDRGPIPRRSHDHHITGEDAAVVVDVTDSPSFAAEAAAGVTHHVALCVMGTRRLPDSGYGWPRTRRSTTTPNESEETR
jgi:hypothetical protein